MAENNPADQQSASKPPFYERPGVKTDIIPVAGGIPFGIEVLTNPKLGIGGAYGAWGKTYDNATLPDFVAERLGHELIDEDNMNLGELGFDYRHHIPQLSDADHLELELEVGARLLREAASSSGWDIADVKGVLIGNSGPVSEDYVEQIARRAGVPDSALKVSVHKACDGSTAALHLALNPGISQPGQVNIAEELRGKKVLVGGIEGLSRFTSRTRDKNALQLFGNGAGAIGIIPGETMKFLVGRTLENYDEEGLLAVRMHYPHSGERIPGRSMLEVSKAGPDHIRVAGLMHQPKDGSTIVMAGLMGMVKLFVRSGVQVVADVLQDYMALMDKLGETGKSIRVSVVHHANYKINLLKWKQLLKEGTNLSMPWVLNDFGNVSAASNMIAFLRQFQDFKPGEHIIFDGFGAGTYYDVLAVSFG